MSPLHSLFLLGLLHLLLPNAQGYTVELTKTDNRGNEGANISITVRLEGLITSSVTVEIELLTLSQFLTKPEAPSGYTLSHDPAEPDDFSHDNSLIHTFSPVISATRQTVDFTIDIVDDTINEKVEQFVVRIVGATTEGIDTYYPELSDALFATVTILIDPKAPDKTKLRMAAPPDGPITVSEGTTGFGLSLMIEAFPPEQDIEVSVTTMELSPFPAVLGSDYNLATTTVTLTRHVTSYTVSMELINDGVPEPKSEGVEVMLSVASGDDTVVFQPRSSVTIIIEDNDRDVNVTLTPETQTVVEGGDANFTCSLLLLNVVSSFLNTIPPGSTDHEGTGNRTTNTDIPGNDTLGIPSVRIFTWPSAVREDNGRQFFCQFGSFTSNTVTLYVNSVPVFVDKDRDLPVTEGSSAVINCAANAYPAIDSLTLTRDNQPLQLSAQGTYTISDAKQSDAGTYVCSATNSLGTETLTITVVVGKVPGQVSDIKVTTDSDGNVVVEWTAADDRGSAIINYKVEIEYGEDKKLVRTAEMTTLTLTREDLEVSNSGGKLELSITVTAVNALGEGQPVSQKDSVELGALSSAVTSVSSLLLTVLLLFLCTVFLFV